MILFNRFTHENLEEMSSLEEDELGKAVQTYQEAADIISRYLSDSPDMLRKYPEISEAFREVNIGIGNAQRLHNVKRQRREEWEEEQRQQRLRDEERKRREEKTYWQYVQQEREKRGLSYGVPPVNNYSCPLIFPIRATDKTKRLGQRGIYYFQNERIGVEVYWCFANPEEAEAERFFRPLKTPPRRQPR
jgi:hypothetical protein